VLRDLNPAAGLANSARLDSSSIKSCSTVFRPQLPAGLI
jgi:hypothetical protein